MKYIEHYNWYQIKNVWLPIVIVCFKEVVKIYCNETLVQEHIL